MAKRHEEMAREIINNVTMNTYEWQLNRVAALLARAEREALERAAAEVERIWSMGSAPGMSLIGVGLSDAIRALLEDS